MPRHTAYRVLLVVALLLVAGAGVLCAEIPPAPDLKTFYTEVPIAHGGAPNCLLVVPSGDEYAQIGQQLAAAIKQVSGATVPVQDAAEVSLSTLRNSNAILLGYFANNPLVERLYDLHYVALDTKWPGAGGYVIRTVHDPTGNGTSFVYLGGADPDSVTKAAADFISSLPQQGDIRYPHTVKIVKPDGSLPYTPNPDSIPERVAEASGKNFGAVGGIVTQAATSYYLTGNPEDLEVFKQTILLLGEFVTKLNKIDAPGGAIHLLNMWDNVEEAPQFTTEDRARITAMLWEFAHKWTDANETGEEDRPTPVGNYHTGRLSWDIARYFHKYYDADAGNLWTTMNVFFKSKAKFWRSAEDCPGYGGATMLDTLYYVMPAGYEQFWESGTGRKMGDYGLAIINNLGGHAGFGDTSKMGSAGYWGNILRMCAWKYKDGRYMYTANRTPGLDRDAMCYSAYLQDDIEPVLPEDMLGVHVVPLPDWVYEHRDSVLGTAPKEMNAVLETDPVPPRHQCFDKITFRTSYEPQDQYLILGGISHGYHAHPDGNAIIEFTDNRRYCLFDCGYFVPDTVEHNTLVVYREGLFEPVPRLTGLSAVGDFSQVGMTQTYLQSYNGVTWRRNIIWNKENYFLIIDEVEAEEAGTYGMSAIFRTLSEDPPQIEPDRASAFYKGVPFNIISASHTPFKTSSTTPPSGIRYAVIESKSARMQPGDKRHFINLLYCGEDEGVWPYELVPVADNVALVKGPDGYALAGTGKSEPLPNMIVDADLFYVREDGFALTRGQTLAATQTWFAADKPLNIELRLGMTATATIEAPEDTVLKLFAKGDAVKLNGNTVKVRTGPDGIELDIPAGKHQLTFQPGAQRIGADFPKAYAASEQAHRQALAALQGGSDGGKQLQAAWKDVNATTATQTIYVNAAGETLKQLRKSGEPKFWTEGSKGTRMRDAVDGRPETYSASYAADPKILPKDFGMEWDNPMQVGNFQIDYVSRAYGPTMAGQQLQAWDGEDWYPIEAEITTTEDGAKWNYVFQPVETTRLRVLITEFDGARSAVCEMRFFSEHATPRIVEYRVPFRTTALAAYDVTGDGRAELVAAIGNSIKCIAGDGKLLWHKDLDCRPLCVDASDLDGDGKGEVVAGGYDHNLYCFDSTGQQRWSVLTPADAAYSEREPKTGRVEVIKCADLDADGKPEIVLGSSNWFAYCYDAAGKLIWKVRNWAHPPTSITFVEMPEGKLAPFIGTRYNSANAFTPEGKGLKSVSVGYHGAAMSVAAGDMDGNGKPELLAGSRVGGVHCDELGSKKAWTKFMGAEVSQVAVADLTGDGKLEAIAGSKNFHLLVMDAAWEILWATNVGEAILDLVVADVSGDETPEIVVATEGGMVRIVDAEGNIIGTLKTGAHVTKLIAADLNGDGKVQITAACDDGFIYGDIK